jgi:pyruvate dehydrogenase phosphatase
LGLPVTRAFGLAPFKWRQDDAQTAWERLWRPKPKHADILQTPPYLTAEQEITRTDLRSNGDHPDFLIMVRSA